MPLFYQHTINDTTKIGVWHITEQEDFYLKHVPLPKIVTHRHKRLQHLAGRFLLEQLYPGFPYHLIEIADTKKPFLTDEKYHFSISHSGDYAAVIISTKHRVGVDIEFAASKIENIKYKFLNDKELSLYHSADKKLLTLLWSAKEAIYKWYGGSEVDFKKHINITQADVSLNAGSLQCEFLKQQPVVLEITYLFFEEICLAWVIQ